MSCYLILATSLTTSNSECEVAAKARPRVDYLDLQRRLDAKVIDFSVYQTGWRRVLERPDRLMRLAWGQALYVMQNWHDYEVILSLSEDIGLPLAFLLKLKHKHPRHIMIVHNLLSKRKQPIVRALNVLDTFDRIIVLSSDAVQGIIGTYGVAPQRVLFSRDAVDERFWHPLEGESVDPGLVLSVGRARRDYPTLLEAIQGLPVRLHIQASSQWFIAYHKKTSQSLDNVSFGQYLSFVEMRALYHRAAFVVIVLEPGAHHSAGTVSVKEAMAMGKAVIVASDGGIEDYVRPDETGIIVQPAQPSDLRAAIEDLLQHPDKAAALGRRGRELVEQTMSYQQKIDRLAQLCRGQERA